MQVVEGGQPGEYGSPPPPAEKPWIHEGWEDLPLRKKPKQKRRKLKKGRSYWRDEDLGRLVMYVPAKRGVHKGYWDTRLRRRDGPVCRLCNKRHYKHQKCWSGPYDARRPRRDWKGYHALSEELAALMPVIYEQLVYELDMEEAYEEQRRRVHEEAARIRARVDRPMTGMGSRSMPSIRSST